MRKHHANIHKCLDYAVRLGLIPFNPSAQVELPAKQKYTGATACTPGQLQGLLQLFRGDPLETVLMLGIAYGLRRSEVCGLRWDAVDMEAGTLHICHTAVKANGRVLYSDSTKTATSNRVLPLTASMREYLGSVRERQEENKRLFGRDYTDSGYICVKPDGTPIDPDFVTHHFRRVLVANDVPIIRFHDLRHPYVKPAPKNFYPFIYEYSRCIHTLKCRVFFRGRSQRNRVVFRKASIAEAAGSIRGNLAQSFQA